ncbi:MAG: hypothetical protein PHU85_08270 [Phycisphaerae bacterium]|nr:hypothetical protein [Phycisphaerae bacterium]
MSKLKSRPQAAKTPDAEARKSRLGEIVRLAQIFIDGDLVNQLLTKHGHLATNGDDIDYNYAPFIAVKKTVLRLGLVPADNQPAHVVLWRQRPDDASKGEPLLAGMKASPFGIRVVPMPKALRAAILNQRSASEEHASGAISVFAPLYDSLHHVVGAVEVFDDPPSM